MNHHGEAVAAHVAFAKTVRLRAAELDDCEAIAALMNLPGVRPDILSHGYRTAASLRDWLENLAANSMIVLAECDGRVIGQAGLMVHTGRRAHSASLGIAVHDAYHGCGVGSLLLGALLEAADNALGLRRIELSVFADNAPAIALYQKFGFVMEARARADAVRDGALHDVFHMARIASAPEFGPAQVPTDSTAAL
ncbi:GNAT family N-acetyltransferase [Paraburkholderia sp. JPY419]|uniref:GNAT family N-acetyltransferase n=1 Tax=Paraburkholderia sp. JPY419 TaxID=667660 RepID=UPI003D219DA6